MNQSAANYSILFLHDGDSSPTVPCAALLLILVLTLSLNSLVLLSILYGPLRSRPCNAFLATVSGVAMLDAIFNVTASIVFRASPPELPPEYGGLCRANAALLQMTGMMQSFAFAALAFDRRSLHQASNATLRWAIPASAAASVAMSLPVGFGLITAALFEHRMACSPAYVSARPVNILIAIITGVTYLTTWVFTLRSSFVIVRRLLSERRRLADLDRVARDARRPVPGADTLWRRVWASAPDGLPVYVLTALLILTFLATVVPNILTVQITQFYPQNSNDERYVIRTNLLDAIFSWSRYTYNVVSPSLILIIHGELRKQCVITFCCCCSEDSPFAQRRRPLPKTTKTVADVATPVLFSTSQGLHIRTVRRMDDEPVFSVRFADHTLDEATKHRKASLNETFVVVPNGRSPRVSRLGETYIFPNGFLNPSPSRINTIEMNLMSEGKQSVFSQSHRLRGSSPPVVSVANVT